MNILNLLNRRLVGAAVLAALTIAPTFALAPLAQAQPRYGYRRNRTVVERYRPRYRSNRTTVYTRRSYVAPRYNRGRYVTRYRNGRAYRVYIR